MLNKLKKAPELCWRTRSTLIILSFSVIKVNTFKPLISWLSLITTVQNTRKLLQCCFKCFYSRRWWNTIICNPSACWKQIFFPGLRLHQLITHVTLCCTLLTWVEQEWMDDLQDRNVSAYIASVWSPFPFPHGKAPPASMGFFPHMKLDRQVSPLFSICIMVLRSSDTEQSLVVLGIYV